MCGIAGIFSYHYAAPNVNREELRTIRDYMANRGPDGSGEWYSANGRVGIGHRRLAIIDLSEKGAQPMCSQDGAFVISFNGEIYNYKELRKDLEQKGYRFQSHSDTEVLLHLYAEKGEAMVNDLRGMFAFALWDNTKRALLLVRDPYGIKPLYYADDGWTLRIASQVKALLSSSKVSRMPEPAGIAGFFLTGSVPEPFTIYQEIRQVPAGCLVWVNSLGPSPPKRYFSMAKVFRDEPYSDLSNGKSLPEKIREGLLDSVRYHFVADVPVGLFLSSGIDSASLLGLARDAGVEDIRTITLAFEEFQGRSDDESPLAQDVARLYGTHHTKRVLSRLEFETELPKCLSAMDQPTIDGINTYFVAKAAAETGLKVALSGLGGDELFGGYPSFRDIPRMVRALAIPSHIPFAGEIYRRLYLLLSPKFLSPKLSGLLKYGGSYQGAYFLRRGLFMPWELQPMIGKEMAQEGLRRLCLMSHIRSVISPDPGTPFSRIAVLESSLYMRNQLLRDSDWAGMAHSLEIRVPYVDIPLFKSLVPLMKKISETNIKSLLAKSPNIPLPDSVARRAKTCFFLPMDEWIRSNGELDHWRNVPALNSERCHWSRRWAYIVMEMQKSS